MPFDDVFELTGLFLLNVRRQEDDWSSQAVILQVQNHDVNTKNNILFPKKLCKRQSWFTY